MKLNRRNALLGIGAIATGGGALFGSGAFSQVSADRTVSVSLADDANALLSLKQGTGATGIVAETTVDGQTIIEFSKSNLNAEATTRWNSALEIVNGSSQSIDVSVSVSSGTAGDTGVMQFEYGSTKHLADTSKTLSNNGDSVMIDIVLDLTNGTDGDIPGTVTFTAS